MTKTEYEAFVQHLVAQMQRDASYQEHVLKAN